MTRLHALTRTLVPALLLACLAAGPGLSADTPAPSVTAIDTAELDTFADAQMTHQGLTGLSLAVVQNGQITATRCYGVASRENGQPVGPDTLFAIGSVTKQFTAACLLLLAEDGKLSVSDPVAKYYPSLTRASDVTLLDLLNHVSGYPDYYPLDFVDGRMTQATMPDVVLSQYATRPLDFDPGTRWSYSNTGYLILGRVVEKVSGRKFPDFLQQRILSPLGLTHTLFAPPDGTPGMAQGYTRFALGGPEKAVREAAGWTWAAGALYSTPTDLARWDMALMTGKILSPESLRLMTTARVLKNGQSDGYGAGLFVRTVSGQTVWSHGGAVSGFLAENEMVPATQSAVVVTVNSDDGDPEVLVSHIQPSLLTATPIRPVPKIDGPAPDVVARRMFSALQAGKIDRTQLGAAYSAFLTPEKLAAASKSLKRWGKPVGAETAFTAERGGMEVSAIDLSFARGVLRGLLYRTPDGKIEEFLIARK